MDIEQAITTRRSIRAFKPDPVPGAVLEDILKVARWSPSGYNTQPWRISVVGGKVLEELKQALVRAYDADPRGRSEIGWYNLGEVQQSRRRSLGYRVLEAKGIAREDRPARREWDRTMLRFFGAPAAMVIYTEKERGEMALCDLGMLTEAIMLSAHGRGLGTCILGIAAQHPDAVRQTLGLDESTLIVMSLAIGYPDLDAPVNRFQREREPLETFVRWQGITGEDSA